jgi:hypothetical protein
MAKDETRRWTNLRTSAGGVAPIKGSQPTKRPGTRRKGGKLKPWFWVRNKKGGSCEGCGRDLPKGEVIAWSRPSRLRCKSCVESTGLNVRMSKKLAEELGRDRA